MRSAWRLDNRRRCEHSASLVCRQLLQHHFARLEEHLERDRFSAILGKEPPVQLFHCGHQGGHLGIVEDYHEKRVAIYSFMLP